MSRYIIQHNRIDGWHIIDRNNHHIIKAWFDNEWDAMYWAINDADISIVDIDFIRNIK